MSGGVTESGDDFSLMEAISRGDRKALDALYDRHAPLLLAICRRVLRDADEADDALVDIFYEIWAKADRFDATRGNPLKYLTTLARSRAIDRSRSRASKPRITSDYTDAAAVADPVLNPLESANLKEQQIQVRQALSALDPAQREALECSFYEGLSHSEIATRLNRPLGTVKTYIRQALIHLRETLRTTQ